MSAIELTIQNAISMGTVPCRIVRVLRRSDEKEWVAAIDMGLSPDVIRSSTLDLAMQMLAEAIA